MGWPKQKKKQQQQETFNSKNEKLQFVGTMSLLKREIAKKMGHRKAQNFRNARCMVRV